MFYIEIVGQGPLLDNNTGKPFFWDAGEEAQAEAKMLNEQAKADGALLRYRVKKDTSDIPRDPFWRKREARRFNDGIYQRVPWWTSYTLHKEGHFPHLSLEQPGYIAYMPSVERGEQDRPERISAGRYLNRYFGNVLTQEQIRTWANKVFAFSKKLEVKFGGSPADFARVYKDGPHTCVPAEQAKLYGAGDLQVAYLEDDGSVVARCICWPEKKGFGRIYPEDQGKYYQELKQQLEAKGWKHYKPDKFGLYYGARLLTKKYSNVPRLRAEEDPLENLYFSSPHLDHAYYVKPTEDGKHLIICEDQGLNARTCGNGYARGFKCDLCGDFCCEAYARVRVHGGYDKIPGGRFVDGKRVCTGCLKKKGQEPVDALGDKPERPMRARLADPVAVQGQWVHVEEQLRAYNDVLAQCDVFGEDAIRFEDHPDPVDRPPAPERNPR